MHRLLGIAILTTSIPADQILVFYRWNMWCDRGVAGAGCAMAVPVFTFSICHRRMKRGDPEQKGGKHCWRVKIINNVVVFHFIYDWSYGIQVLLCLDGIGFVVCQTNYWLLFSSYIRAANQTTHQILMFILHSIQRCTHTLNTHTALHGHLSLNVVDGPLAGIVYAYQFNWKCLEEVWGERGAESKIYGWPLR